ncbi:ribosomal RNA small subunit methyltransferase A [Candidatus Uhrbacteria bacterium CG10_big_fil_rev_8_21_14_0_10_50_16]|uniref:Ribosomal RNA small subunit methyltransferase A n=1 Tax=Candidatus Uhrbacteria bacterium CG10_big_fil_rev_8_21_14_0_10_50_16 TaxID=1975039 RepID=A0A2H0RLD8_9BACT|nr:MAG: ribosomal RNA small subunit methyltransferase A [Candidatus Uhrbacteria bacterium CG10_big_fil_rev_8_21_14_0_10_50_16]
MEAKKFFGQHFLRDDAVIAAIVEAADVAGLPVLEVGPGEGVLTEVLVQQAARVVAVDVDTEAIEATRARIASTNLELIERDVLDARLEDVRTLFTEAFVLVGNLPYNITSDLLRWMLSVGHKPLRAVIMVQKEVADRLTAEAGDMSLLGLMVQLYASVQPVVQVPRTAFAPPPKVDSAVVRLDVYTQEDLDAHGVRNPEKLLSFAGVAFAQKRKQLKSTLGTLPSITISALEEALRTLSHPATARPQELSTDEWIRLYNLLHEYC